jgi:hypothetical protein
MSNFTTEPPISCLVIDTADTEFADFRIEYLGEGEDIIETASTR